MKLTNKDKVRNLRRLRYGTAATVLTIVVIVGVLLLNIIADVLADRYPLALDMSSDKVFTLSEESVNIAETVKNDVEIVVFSSEDIFLNPTTGASAGIPEFDTTLREFHNALRQYRTHSNNKVSFQFIDPDQEPAKYAAYEKYGVTSADILFISGERHKVCSISDLYALDDSNYYIYGTYEFYSNVEKVIASNIHNLQSENERVVQVLVGHEEDPYTIAGLKALYELNGYTFEELNITASAEFHKDAEVLLIAAPAQDYSDAEIKRVQEWMFNKGAYNRHLIVFTNPVASCPNLYELLDVEYGIQVTDELLLETDMNRMQNYTPNYTLCDVPATKFTANSASTGKLSTPIARRLTTSWATEAAQDNAIANLSTVLNSYPETARLIKLQDFNENKTDGIYQPPADQYPLTSMIAATINSYDNNTQQAAYGTVVVSGSAAMAYADFIQNGSLRNEDLLLDTVNSVTGHENSVSISNKILDTEMVVFTPNAQLIVGLGVFTVGIPVIVLIICVIVFLRRKNL